MRLMLLQANFLTSHNIILFSKDNLKTSKTFFLASAHDNLDSVVRVILVLIPIHREIH